MNKKYSILISVLKQCCGAWSAAAVPTDTGGGSRGASDFTVIEEKFPEEDLKQ